MHVHTARAPAQVALYFAFLECFTNSLLPLATLGTPAVLYGWWRHGSADNPWVLFYSIATLLWVTLFCQYWRRQEARLSYRWGTESFEDEEGERRQFVSLPDAPESQGFYTPEGWSVSQKQLLPTRQPQPQPQPIPQPIPQHRPSRRFVSKTQLRAFSHQPEGGSGGAAASRPHDSSDLRHEECPLRRDDVKDFVESHEWRRRRRFDPHARWPRQCCSISILVLVTACGVIGSLSLLSTMTIVQASRRQQPSPAP